MKLFLLSLAFVSLYVLTVTGQQSEMINDKELRAWADNGDADSQFELGLRLLTGEGLKKNEAEGVTWVEKAAAQKHLRAQFVLGSLYEEGVGVKKNEATAFEWYRKSAENGFAAGQHAVAMAYDLGRGVKLDPEKATEWLEKAAEQNHAPAQTALAAKYERGVGTAKSPSKAALFYLRAAQQDFVPAMSRLANLYYTGVGVPVDFRRAGAWYQRAARSEDPWAANNLAWFLSTCPDENLHNGEQAVQLATRALRIMDEAGEEQRYEMIDTKAACLARNGEFLEAVLWQKKALALLPADKELPPEERKSLETEFQSRLKLYQKQTPYTEAEPKQGEETAPLPQDTILQEEGIPGAPTKPKNSKSKSRGTVV
ncbi:TPR repeat protein [Prosthecobacter fusiformis]|uniref:TPR repeat protein n=1 Tax=Prosthecobacter fusiformis TaxID=48464 RepID=A0A4R7S6U9_9BACT|nr:tetratricopeptide repeat protein [Prosthecobacter fusiformis]TDU73298.1 TPR repeat protein [Prosthecobacter fusiformis]